MQQHKLRESGVTGLAVEDAQSIYVNVFVQHGSSPLL